MLSSGISTAAPGARATAIVQQAGVGTAQLPPDDGVGLMPSTPDRTKALTQIQDPTLDPGLIAGQRIALRQHRIRLAQIARPNGSQALEEILKLSANGLFSAQAHGWRDPSDRYRKSNAIPLCLIGR